MWKKNVLETKSIHHNNLIFDAIHLYNNFVARHCFWGCVCVWCGYCNCSKEFPLNLVLCLCPSFLPHSPLVAVWYLRVTRQPQESLAMRACGLKNFLTRPCGNGFSPGLSYYVKGAQPSCLRWLSFTGIEPVISTFVAQFLLPSYTARPKCFLCDGFVSLII